MNGYLTLHVLGAILFVGNIVTAALWKTMADRTGNPAVIHQAARNVMMADWAFTVPGLILLVVSGALMAERGGYALDGLNWLTLSLLLFGLSGAIWLAALIPLQRRMIRLSEESLRTGVPSDAYRKASRNWAIFGTAATLLPIVILYLMVSQTGI
ncbi:membrane protein [Cohnella xylanilytica]|uniref:DUF2269 domain-containing protein n=1 Tax=Cohnella xylanilytica TaxID=557555 RepID=A0A841TXR6_9BACL|nr:DUF2269 family protein [Cohnella xylanilytica]MBB6692389.1 DUF2269 domain-containing protein [Cohnella xylanilytica]GIO12521.1 membrane protein [Cohnella xylanilytica]